jgi:glyoxylase-like metal-dependent hydrolase (beta-lactamase superfamily II)
MICIESGGRTAVFTADLMPTTAHVDVPWIMAYDLYPMETLEFKRAFVKEAVEREYLIFFEHDPHVAAGYIRQEGRSLTVEPVV